MEVIIISFFPRLKVYIQGMRHGVGRTPSTLLPDPNLILSHPPTSSSNSTYSSPQGTFSVSNARLGNSLFVLQFLEIKLKTQTRCANIQGTTTSIHRVWTRELTSLAPRSMGKGHTAVLEDHTNGTSWYQATARYALPDTASFASNIETTHFTTTIHTTKAAHI